MNPDITDIKELINKSGFTFSKSKGQNFLTDPGVPEKIVRMSGIDENCGVLEAGPGLGALTSQLCRVAGQVVAVELDRRLIPILNEAFRETNNVEIVNGDILKLDLAALVREKMPGKHYHICANLPYNITTPALTAFTGAGVFETVTVMIQKEVAERINADPGTSAYGSFSVYAGYHYAQLKTLFDVPPECFIPRPAVHSSVITMVRRTEALLSPEKEKVFFGIVRAAFGQRRKTLVNALHSVYGGVTGKSELTDAVTASGFDANIRGEVLGVDDYIRLTEIFIKITEKNR